MRDASWHPSTQDLRHLLSGTPTVEDVRRIEAHVTACAKCCARMGQLDTGSQDASIVRRLKTATAATQSAPRTIGRYDIRRPLGGGGMGTIFLAYDPRLQREVALKIPRADMLADPQIIDRFHREARAMARVHHPNVCPVYDTGESDGTHFLTMRYVEGAALSERIIAGRPWTGRDAATLVAAVARGLAASHKAGVVHRDLKPSNVILDNGTPVVTDFGLAKEAAAADSGLTQDNVILGSPHYMSPEQIESPATIGPASDVYSLGVLFYQLLTGKLPFEGRTAIRVLTQVASAAAVAPSAINPDIERTLESFCLTAMARDPADRFDATALADALEAYLAGLGVRGPLDADAARPAGTRFGGFEIIGTLHRDANGTLYQAIDCADRRLVALHALRPFTADEDEPRRAFTASLDRVRGLSIPGIARLHAAGVSDDTPYFVRELVVGQALAEMAANGPLPLRDATAYVAAVAASVETVHRAGVCHSDLRPEHVTVSGDNRPIVAGFGVADALRRPAEADRPAAAAFAAPERLHALTPATTAADVYGLGAILYFLITGRPPCVGPTVAATFDHVLHRDPIAPRVLNPGVDRDLEQICLKCLRKQPARRYATAGALLADLRRHAAGEPVEARPLSYAARLTFWARRRPLLSAGFVAVVATGLLVSGLLFTSTRAAELDRARAAFQGDARDRMNAIKSEITRQTDVLYVLRDIFQAQGVPSAAVFERIAMPVLGRTGSIHALEWVPRVTAADRAAHEQAAAADGHAGYRIRWRLFDELVPAGERADYFPVRFVVPTSQALVLGYDLGSEPTRRAALRRADATDLVSATQAVRLVQDASEPGFLALAAVKRPATTSPADDESRLDGFVLGVFRIRDIVRTALGTFSDDCFVTLREADGTELFNSPAVHDAGPAIGPMTFTMDVGGRPWTVNVAAAPAYTRAALRRAAFTTVGGLLTTALAASVLLLLGKERPVPAPLPSSASSGGRRSSSGEPLA